MLARIQTTAYRNKNTPVSIEEFDHSSSSACVLDTVEIQATLGKAVHILELCRSFSKFSIALSCVLK